MTQATTNPEIRLRLDREEHAQFERVGMNANDMVRVFIKRSIAVGGFPFEMRAPANDVSPPGERNMPIHGVSVPYIADVASKAARDAHADHIAAGRMETSAAAQAHTR